MPSQLDVLIRLGETPAEDRKPFAKWKEPWTNKTVRMRLLTASESEEVLRELSSIPTLAIPQRSPIEILARSIVAIDGVEAVSSADLERHNKENNSSLTMLDYKRMLFGKMDPNVIGQLDAEYRVLADEHVEKLMGEVKNSQTTPEAEPSGRSDSKSGSTK